MQLENLLGNQGFKQSVQAAMQSGRLGHAVLLAAPEGCGRGFAARCLAADYLFPQGGRGAQAVMRGESSELLLVQGEGKSGQISVERIRRVREEIYHSSLSASGRVVWIQDAQRMAPPAFNALLKVLEEPPPGALFVLTAPDSSSIPLTIQSRCALYPLAPLPKALCAQALQKKLPPGGNAQLPGLLAALYGGALGLCLKAMEQPERLDILRDALRLAGAAAKGERYGMLCILAAYEGRAEGDRERREALLDDMASALETGLRGEVIEGLPPVPPATAAALLPFVGQARVALRGNAAPKISFAAMAAQMAQCFGQPA